MKAKIWMLLFVGMLPVAISSYLMAHLAKKSAEAYETVNSRHLQDLLRSKSAKTLFEIFNKNIEIALTTTDSQDTASHFEALAQIQKELKIIQNRGQYQEELSDINTNIERFPQEIDQFFKLLEENSIASPSVLEAGRQISSTRKRVADLLEKLEELCQKDYDNQFVYVNSAQKTYGTLIITVMVCGLFIVALFNFAMMSPVLKRMATLQKHFSNTVLDKLEPIALPKVGDELDSLVETSNAMLSGMKQARKQLIDMQFIDHIIASLGDMLIILDSHGVITRTNSQVGKILGLEEGSLNRKKFGEVFAPLQVSDPNANDENPKDLPPTIETIERDMSQHLKHRQQFTGELVIKGKGGKVYYLHLIGQCLSEGKDDFMVLSMRDMTAFKEAQAENQKIQQELHHTAKLAALGTLGAGVAHELNNPLAGIIGFADAIQAESNGVEPYHSIANKILRCGRRMSKIIDHLRTVSRDSSKIEDRVFGVNEPIEEALMILESQLQNNGITLALDLPNQSEMPYLKGNSIDVGSVVQNLVVNAQDALQDLPQDRPKKITIAVSATRDEITLKVSDNANGIPKDVLPRIFDPFFTTKDIGKGTGLGLSIIHRIVTESKGTIDVDSNLGVGTSFTVKLPRTYPQGRSDQQQLTPGPVKQIVPKKDSQAASIPLPTPMATPAEKPTLVVIDDDDGITDILDFYLKPNFTVKTYNDSVNAVTDLSAAHEKPDLILTDMRMPGMNGLSVLRELVPKCPRTTFLVITGHGNNHQESREALDLGAQKIIGKPFPDSKDLILELEQTRKSFLENLGLKKTAVGAPTKYRVVMVDDDPDNLEVISFYLGDTFNLCGFTDPYQCLHSKELVTADILLTDLNLGGLTGIELIVKSNIINPNLIYLLISGAPIDQDNLEKQLAPQGSSLMEKIIVLSKPFEGRTALHGAIESALKRRVELPRSA